MSKHVYKTVHYCDERTKSESRFWQIIEVADSVGWEVWGKDNFIQPREVDGIVNNSDE